jgi:MFS family permease
MSAMLSPQEAADELRPRDRGSLSTNSILLYFAILNLLLGLGSPAGLPAIPIAYFLKDHLHLGPIGLATFTAAVSAPVYVAFLFGFFRDRFRAQLGGDRGCLAIGSAFVGGCYVMLAAYGSRLAPLVAFVLLGTIAFLLVYAAAQAMLTTVAQARMMSGRLSIIQLAGYFAPQFLAALAGGWMVTHVSARGTFVIAGGIIFMVVVQMFASADPETTLEVRPAAAPERSLAAIARLAHHRPIWIAAFIWFLWNFSPGWQTPMFYHLSNTVKISSAAYGLFNGLFNIGNLPTMLIYGLACRRAPLKNLLLWGTIIAIAQGPIMFFAQDTWSAMIVGAMGGLLGGFPTAAYMDLIVRSCPVGLEGTGVMLSTAAYAIAGNSGNVFGSFVYAHGGFTVAIIVTTLATALILPLLWAVSPELVATREGETLEF